MEKNFKIIESDENQHSDDFYVRLKEKLQEIHTFPTEYMFKYIAPSEPSIIARLYSIFQSPEANVSTRDSKNGKYTSVTIQVPVNDVDDIIIYYKQASEIDGIMAL